MCKDAVGGSRDSACVCVRMCVRARNLKGKFNGGRSY